MEEIKINKQSSYNISKTFEERVNNRFSSEDNSLFGNNEKFSNLFEKDNSISPLFTVLRINFERATLREASSFKSFMEKQIAEDQRNIIVDLNNCDFVDSSFLGVLVGGIKRLKAMNLKFLLIYDSKNRLPIFSASGLGKVFNVYRSVDDAISEES